MTIFICEIKNVQFPRLFGWNKFLPTVFCQFLAIRSRRIFFCIVEPAVSQRKIDVNRYKQWLITTRNTTRTPILGKIDFSQTLPTEFHFLFFSLEIHFREIYLQKWKSKFQISKNFLHFLVLIWRNFLFHIGLWVVTDVLC